MNQFTKLQRRILAILEEAGEENISALTNTVARVLGASAEIETMHAAVSNLLNERLVDIATCREASSHCWIPLPMSEGLAVLKSIRGNLEWSAGAGIWKWRKGTAVPEVLLTEAGIELARRVIAEDGWPAEALARWDE